MNETLAYPGGMKERRFRLCKLIRNAQVCQSEIKTSQTALIIIQIFLGPFAGGKLRAISSKIALNLRTAGAKVDRSPMADVSIWPESQKIRSVT